MAECNFNFPGNAAARANVAVDGNQVTISGTDSLMGVPFHTTVMKFDASNLGYSEQDTWYGITGPERRGTGGRPVNYELGHLGNEVRACGINLRKQGLQAEGDLLSRIGRQLHNGSLLPK